MALLVPYSDPKLKKQFMLKDYLSDELNSCSSSGFRSFTRRQCCTPSVRFLIEINLTKKNKSHHQPPTVWRSKSADSSTAKSAFQKASDAVINVVKHLPFAAAVVKPKKTILPSSFSRKLFKRSFWKKSDRKEIERWKSFQTVVEKKSDTSDFSLSKTTTVTTAVTNPISSTKCSSSSSESSGKSKKSYSSSWSDSEFTRSSSCSSGNSETVNSCEKVLPDDEVGKIVGEDSTDATTTPTANCIIDSPKKQWPNEEAKEQFSPVSVLDYPFDNDDAEAEEEVSSPFKRRAARVEGPRHKLMQKLRRFESLSQLEPVDLEKRIALSDFDRESVGSTLQTCLLPILENNISDEEEEEDNETETKAVELLEEMKAKTPSVSFKFKAENLFLDFFREGIIEENAYDSYELLDVAKDWINGKPQELFLGWEVQRNRQAYIRDMEKGGMWGKLEEDKEEVALELEADIFTSLVNHLFLDLFNLAM